MNRDLLGLLASRAWRTVLELSLVARASACAAPGVSLDFRERLRDRAHPGGENWPTRFPEQAEARATTGTVFTIQTCGDMASHHPHSHAAVSDGEFATAVNSGEWRVVGRARAIPLVPGTCH